MISFLLLTNVGCAKINFNNDKPIIKVNNEVITKGQFDRLLKSNIDRSPIVKAVGIKEDETDFFYLMLKSQAVGQLIDRKLIDQAIKENKITVSDDEAKEYINNFIKRVGEKRYNDEIKKNKVSKDHVLSNVKRQIAIDKLVNKELAGKKPSEQEIIAYYKKNKEKKYTHIAEVKAQHILIRASKDEILASNQNLTDKELDKKYEQISNAALVEAKGILEKVKKQPEKFGEFAKKYSQDEGTADQNGDLGYFSHKMMLPQFSNVAFALKKDEISGIVKTQYGYHIIKVNDVKKPGVDLLDDVRDKISENLAYQLRENKLMSILNSKKKVAKIEYIDPSFDMVKINTATINLLKSEQSKAKNLIKK